MRHVRVPCILLSRDLRLRSKPVIQSPLADPSLINLAGSLGNLLVKPFRPTQVSDGLVERGERFVRWSFSIASASWVPSGASTLKQGGHTRLGCLWGSVKHCKPQAPKPSETSLNLQAGHLEKQDGRRGWCALPHRHESGRGYFRLGTVSTQESHRIAPACTRRTTKIMVPPRLLVFLPKRVARLVSNCAGPTRANSSPRSVRRLAWSPLHASTERRPQSNLTSPVCAVGEHRDYANRLAISLLVCAFREQ